MKKFGTLAAKTIGPLSLTMCKCVVPQRIREEMHWEITAQDLLRRRRIHAVSSVLGRIVPRPLYLYYGYNLLDLRLRRKLGLPVF